MPILNDGTDDNDDPDAEGDSDDNGSVTAKVEHTVGFVLLSREEIPDKDSVSSHLPNDDVSMSDDVSIAEEDSPSDDMEIEVVAKPSTKPQPPAKQWVVEPTPTLEKSVVELALTQPTSGKPFRRPSSTLDGTILSCSY